MMNLLVLMPGLFGCSGDTDTGLVEDGERPDVAGSYNVVLGGVAGCGGKVSYVQGWAEGPMKIEGPPEALVFDFGDGIELEGQVTATRGFTFFGVFDYEGVGLSTACGGSFKLEDDRWVLSGDFEIEVDEDPKFKKDNCTMTGPVEAFQID